VQLDAISAVWDPPERAQAMLERSLSIARVGLDETRRALQALRATPLEEVGLVLAIQELAESVTARNGWTLTLDLPEQLGALSPEVEQCYYRVAQEALENVSQHADAHNITLSLSRNETGLILEISDDGVGFPQDAEADQSFGIKGMRERAELIGGTLEMESHPGQGTTVRLCSGVC